MMNLDEYIGERVARIDAELDRYLPAGKRLPTSLHQAMRYSIFAGGKRIRPLLMIAACEAAGGMMTNVLPAACAILTQAFILLAATAPEESVSAAERLRVLQIIATAAGSLGMVGGQVVDMESETKSVELPIVEYIHTHKTGALILASLQAGAILGGAASSTFATLTRYGECAGLAFQIADDILDIVGEQALLGKDVGSDVHRGKATYPALLGLAESRRRAEELRDLAIDALAPLDTKAEPLRALVSFIVDRSR